MKTINVRDLQKKIRQCVDLAQREHVVVTRHGRPAAIVIGVEGKDWEDVFIQTNASFWTMIQDRRTETTISLAEMRAPRRPGAPPEADPTVAPHVLYQQPSRLGTPLV